MPGTVWGVVSAAVRYELLSACSSGVVWAAPARLGNWELPWSAFLYALRMDVPGTCKGFCFLHPPRHPFINRQSPWAAALLALPNLHACAPPNHARAYPLQLSPSVEKAQTVADANPGRDLLTTWVLQAAADGALAPFLAKLRAQPQILTAYARSAMLRDTPRAAELEKLVAGLQVG